MQLWLLRHARARAASGGEKDRERPLSDSGRHTAARLGEWIRENAGSLPGRILVSPALRTRQTADLVLAQTDAEPSVEPRLWDALEEDLVRIINDNVDAEDGLMLIAHNPSLEWLVQWLSNQRLRLGMQPGTLAVMDIEVPPAPGSGRLEKLVQPSDLA
ncbi:MAG: SixA phosphatase family protein [Wenzhouxiangella sp.]